jgi:glycosyltransferase involved in cell wall biosynthesis
MGHRAISVRLPALDGTHFPGILQVSRKEMESSQWWRTQGCELVVANTWGLPLHTPLVQAIKAAGARIVVRLDSDGFHSPWNGLLRFVRVNYFIARTRHSPAISLARAVALTASHLNPFGFDRKMLQHLALADVVGIESEGAKRRLLILLSAYGKRHLARKVHVLRHPVAPDICDAVIPDAGRRDNRILAVGRWESPQKDATLLTRVLGSVLSERKDWDAVIVGSGEGEVAKLARQHAQTASARVTVSGMMSRQELINLYAKSKICISTSRFESGPIAGQEALCMGCTVVAPPDVPSSLDLCAPEFGTMPRSRSVASMAEALIDEITKWESSIRVPSRIGAEARSLFSPDAVCREILSAVQL